MPRLLAALLLAALLGGCSPMENETVYNLSMVVRSEVKRRLPKPESVPRVDAPQGAEALLHEPTPTATARPDPSPTPKPTVTPSPSPTAEPAVASAADPGAPPPAAGETTAPGPEPTAEPAALPADPGNLPPLVRLSGASHEYQRWNNCGPATLAMYLTFWGEPVTQYDTEKFLKPDREDKNVTPQEMAAYARDQGYRVMVGVNGTLPLLKTLLAAGYPLVAETWFEPFGPSDGMGHYRLLLGYDEAAGQFSAFDSYNGPNVALPYGEFDRLWRVFNRTFLLALPPQDGERVGAILAAFGSGFPEALNGDPTAMHLAALERARAEAREGPGGAFAWFNLGSSLAALERYEEAAQAFDQARHLGLPWRMLWYQFGPFEAYHHVGRHQDVLDLATANLAQAGNLEESHYWRGLSLRALGREEEARRAFQTALRFNPNFTPAADALNAS